MFGFRSGKLWKKVISITYLIFWAIIFLCIMLGDKYKNITTYDFIITKIEYIIYLIIFITPYIFLSNTKMRHKLPLFKAGKKSKSILGLLIVNIILMIISGFVNEFHSQEYLADMANHDYQINKKTEPTCENSGEANYLCAYCGITKNDTIPALGHDMKEISKKEATCEKDGVISEKCNRCTHSSETPLKALGHNMKEVSKKAAACEEDGILYEKCDRCNHSNEAPLKALGHDMKQASKKDATCEKDGVISEKCTRCNHSKETVLPASGHDMKQASTKEATCEENGLISKKCNNCDYTEETTLPATGHNMKEISKTQPTENTDGSIIKKCTLCGKEDVEIIRRLGKTEEEYKAECRTVSYEDIARNPDNYVGAFVVFNGKVAQIQESGNNIVIRLNVTRGDYGIWEDTVYIEYTRGENESRILEEDNITVYGELNGIKTYTAVLGNSISIPYLKAKYIELN